MLFSFCPIFLFGQVEINFESGLSQAWNQYPADRWGVVSEGAINGSKSLAHIFDNSESGKDFISFSLNEPDLQQNIRWIFSLRYDYKPSGSNNWCAYLLSDQDACGMASFSQNNALMIGVNQKETDDSLRLYSQWDGIIKPVLNLGVNWELDVGMNTYNFIIEKNSEGKFFIYGGLNKAVELICETNDLLILPEFPEYFGLGYEYTSSKDQLLFFDDFQFEAVAVVDSLPPENEELNFLSAQEIEFVFNEAVFFSEQTDFLLQINENSLPDSFFIEGNKLHCFFSESFENDSDYHFSLDGLSDRKGNAGMMEGYFSFYFPVIKDIVITEIMADPTPEVYLPESEYVEIYIRGGHNINLNNFSLSIGKDVFVLKEIIICAGQYFVFCKADVEKYTDTTVYYPLFSSSSQLSNTGEELILKASDGTVIDLCFYSEYWGNDDFKSEGGWSLERIDLNNLCGEGENWSFSCHKSGGTPGFENSVNGIVNDKEEPYIRAVEYEDSLHFKLEMNESVNFLGTKSFIDEDDQLSSLSFMSDYHKSVLLELTSPLKRVKAINTAEFVEDCSGNINLPDTLLLCYSEEVEELDLIISEIMFAPFPGCTEFIELFNRSDKAICLNELLIETGTTELVSAGEYLSERKILFYPGTYLVLCSSALDLQQCYSVSGKKIVEMKALHGMTNESGRIRILNRSYSMIDEFTYHEDMQFEMLGDNHGVSLERLDHEKQFGSLSEWHSASQTSNYATPGEQNSQYQDEAQMEDSFSMITESFTPDNNGTDDVAIMQYLMPKEGFVGSLLIFNASGGIEKNIGSNILLGNKGFFYWDGRNDQGNLCHSGIYLACFKCFHLDGVKEIYRCPVVLIRNY